MSDVYLQQINAKIVKNKRVEFNELQCVSLYAHNDTATKLKGLKIDDNDLLMVTDNNTSLSSTTLNDESTLGVSLISEPVPIIKNTGNISILLEAPNNSNDINHISLTVLVSNIFEYFELDADYIEIKKNDNSIQALIKDYKPKNIKIKLENNKGSDIDFSLSVVQ